MDNKAAIITKYGDRVEVTTKRVPETLTKDQVLVKVMCATIHPSDLNFLQGMYGYPRPEKFPMTPGFEGSGVIYKVAENLDYKLVGKRVCITGDPNTAKNSNFQGLWTQYYLTSIHSCILFDFDIEFEKICFSFVNPLTACGFIDTFRKNGGKAIIQNGASSALGKMLIKLCVKEGIEIINIVRNETHFENLTQIGAKYLISTSSPNWKKQLTELSGKLKANIFFDCVGGEMTGKFLAAIPDGSILFHYGNLEIKRIAGIDSSELLFKRKVLKGWWLTYWMRSISFEELKKWKEYVIDDFRSNKNIFFTNYSKVYQLEQVQQAIEFYMAHMSEGKVIIKPNF